MITNKEIEIEKMRAGIKALEAEGKRVSDDPRYNTPEGDELLDHLNKQWKEAKIKLAEMERR